MTNNKEWPAFLFVERDDSAYDYKADFSSFAEANNYRLECQRRWMSHLDYVWLYTGHNNINLTYMAEDERRELLRRYNIPE